MRTECLRIHTLLAGAFALAIGAVACSADDTPGDGETGGSGGTSPGTGGSSGRAAGGSSAGGSSGTGGTGVSTGGTGTGGTATGGTGTGGTATGGTGTGGTATGGASGSGTGATGGLGAGGASGMGAGGASGTGAGGAGAGGMGGAVSGGMGGATAGQSGGGRGGGAAGGAGRGGSGTGGSSSGTCTASQAAGQTVTGTGPHKVVIESNSANGIKCGTIYRPADLGGAEKYPIFVWGEGGCSQDGLSNKAAMGEIASWGYFVVADGTANGNSCSGGQDGKALLDYITWAIAENDKSCSAYYQSLEPTKIAADGFSCGGLMSENVSGDARFTAIGITSSGLMSANKTLYDKIHTPFKIMNGGSSDIAYENGLRDYDEISKRGIPIVYFSKTSLGHGGDLGNGRGEFNKVNLAWLNWQLKGDTGETGKGYLNGSTCKICTDSGWTYKSANIQ